MSPDYVINFNKRNKYRAQSAEHRGVRFASKAEAARAAELDAAVKSGDVLFWIAQPKVRLGSPVYTYTPDFLVVYAPDTHVKTAYEDVKGVETPSFRKHVRMWSEHGPAPLYIVKRKGKRLTIDRIIPACGKPQSGCGGEL